LVNKGFRRYANFEPPPGEGGARRGRIPLGLLVDLLGKREGVDIIIKKYALSKLKLK
jgi:hypothetical protein